MKLIEAIQSTARLRKRHRQSCIWVWPLRILFNKLGIIMKQLKLTNTTDSTSLTINGVSSVGSVVLAAGKSTTIKITDLTKDYSRILKVFEGKVKSEEVESTTKPAPKPVEPVKEEEKEVEEVKAPAPKTTKTTRSTGSN